MPARIVSSRGSSAGPVAELREDHRLLGAEVAEEGRGVDIGAIRDVVHGDGVETPFGKELQRNCRQAISRLEALSLPPTGGRGGIGVLGHVGLLPLWD
jgi:hypothetical protein